MKQRCVAYEPRGGVVGTSRYARCRGGAGGGGGDGLQRHLRVRCWSSQNSPPLPLPGEDGRGRCPGGGGRPGGHPPCGGGRAGGGPGDRSAGLHWLRPGRLRAGGFVLHAPVLLRSHRGQHRCRLCGRGLCGEDSQAEGIISDLGITGNFIFFNLCEMIYGSKAL